MELRLEEISKIIRSQIKHYESTVEHDETGSTLCTTMAHVFEYLQGVIDQLMTLVTVDIHHHTYATRIVLIG